MIKFIYFDVGGVLIKDFSATDKWKELQTDLGIKPKQEKEFIEFYDKYEPDICLGKDADELIPLIEDKFNLKVPEGYSLLKNGFVNRFEVNQSIWPIVDIVQSKYKVGLLTNMYPNMLDEIKKTNLLPPGIWNILVDSSVDKVKKPDREIFELAQNRAGVSSEEILFIDNGAKHIKAAKDFGWQTFWFDSSNYPESSEKLAKYLDLQIRN